MSFETLGLAPALLRALAEHGYTTPTPIQAAAIPVVLAGRDLLAGAQTGTGKTAAFALPLLQRLFVNAAAGVRRRQRKPRALILTPTRELAAQVHDSIRGYAKHLRMSQHGDLRRRRHGSADRRAAPRRRHPRRHAGPPDRPHGTPHASILSGIEILVLDEADRMLDMGFLPAIRRILAALPKQRQTLLFSATFADEIKQLAAQFMRDPAEIQVAARNTVAVGVTHRVHPVDGDAQARPAAAPARRRQPPPDAGVQPHQAWRRQTRRRSSRNPACARAAIHGNKSQGARTQCAERFQERQDHRARRHRHRRARTRHRSAAGA